MSASSVRGRVRISGGSTGNGEETTRAIQEGAAYVDFGAVYKLTQKDAGTPIRLDGLRNVGYSVNS